MFRLVRSRTPLMWAVGILVVLALQMACFATSVQGSIGKPSLSISAAGQSPSVVFSKDHDGFRSGTCKGDEECFACLQWVATAGGSWRADLWPMVVRLSKRLDPPKPGTLLLDIKVRLQI